MGPNGSGKSTLAKVIVGHPDYEVVEGEILLTVDFKTINILELEPEERAILGVFLGFQYPIEVPGVNTLTFLHSAYNAICRKQGVNEMGIVEFKKYVQEKMKMLDIDKKFINRSLNVDFSGGEKKRNEILQMAILNPKFIVLDEIDSGLDIDSMRIVADGVNRLKNKEKSLLIITHYQRLLNGIIPDYVHILHKGRIIKNSRKRISPYKLKNKDMIG